MRDFVNMCGFAGFMLASCSSPEEELRDIVFRMADTLYHRGPDDRGAWVDASAGVALGFRRLAIIDLSPEGHQPMKSATGRYVLAFNGEIYNHSTLRKQLERGVRGEEISFRGHSDTEVMLAAFEAWGVETSLPLFVGMFALVLWDRQERCLYLSRDRIGEKPLYYGWMGSTFLFGSELKALRKHPHFHPRIRRETLKPYLRHGYIPSPCSIYEGIFKLLPGTFLALKELLPGILPAPVAYWLANAVFEAGASHPFIGSDSEAISRLDGLLHDSVGLQMVADVPLGAFLSGGVDSSIVVAHMQARSLCPVKTFTIGFHNEMFNEAKHARAVAQHLGTDHTEVYVSGDEALALVPRLPEIYDEPFADPSQIPTLLVSQIARQSVTVSLSGDGGDELFAGYLWYKRVSKAWNIFRWLPAPLRHQVSFALGAIPVRNWNSLLGLFQLLPQKALHRIDVQSIQKIAFILNNSDSLLGLHRSLNGTWNGRGVLVSETLEPLSGLAGLRAIVNASDPITRLQGFDLLNYLPDDILVKIDRASMAASLETRTPFLDYRLVEFSARLPLYLKVRGGKTKWLLRQVLYRYVPSELIERPKCGFDVPLASWLRGPLRDWAEDLLRPELLREQGFFVSDVLREQWQEHLTGKQDWSIHLWHVLMFQSWLRTQ
jgi:asparagine synthase (glutamine-hydrolysing)